MKIKKKGKVHPSPSSNDREMVVVSVLKLLPAAILALASVLSLDDREVLAYMITRSLKTTSPSSSSSSSSSTKKKPSSKKHPTSPVFECECFDCYTSFWVRWDSSPNRDLIHRVIDAFEDHLISSENNHNHNKPTNKKKSRSRESPAADVAPPPQEEESKTADATAGGADGDRSCVVSRAAEEVDVDEKSIAGPERNNNAVLAAAAEEEEGDDVAAVVRAVVASEHRGLARKVLPDVLGLFNSRLWSLWSPNA